MPKHTVNSNSLFSPTPDLQNADIEDQVQRILTSEEFVATKAQRALLEFVIEKKLSGHEDQIKGYTIATEVFDRNKDFNQATDPVVSIQAGKLRRALERYYLVAGRNDPLRIDIPKGTYVPTVSQNERSPAPTLYEGITAFAEPAVSLWPRLIVYPITNLTAETNLDLVGAAISSEIAMEVVRYHELEVCRIPNGPSPANEAAAGRVGARFALQGCLKREKSGYKVNAFLTDLTSNVQIWADNYHTNVDSANLMFITSEVARVFAGKICSENGVIARQLSLESTWTENSARENLTPYEAILRYHEFCTTFTQSTFLQALRALEWVAESDPDCGLIWSMLARLYATNYATELFEVETPIEHALQFARNSIRLEPGSQRTRGGFAFVLMLAGELPAARKEADRALELHPNSLIFIDNIGYLLTLLGDWERGTALVRKAIKNNPYYNPVVHHALWLDCFRQQEYQRAYNETLFFRTSGLFWDHLAKASTLGHLGRIEEGSREAEWLLRCKPDFRQRGSALIRHFIKYDDIANELTTGLQQVGIILDSCAENENYRVQHGSS